MEAGQLLSEIPGGPVGLGARNMSDLEVQFGQIDIYVFDQLLRGRLKPAMRVLDAGCGSGRNLVYLLRSGYEIFGADVDVEAIESVRRLAAALAPQLSAENFRVEPVERMTFPDAFADVVLSSAVLHFAGDDRQFAAMVQGMWRVLKPRGMLFCRLASDDWNGNPGAPHERPAVSAAGWIGTLPGRRGHARRAHP